MGLLSSGNYERLFLDFDESLHRHLFVFLQRTGVRRCVVRTYVSRTRMKFSIVTPNYNYGRFLKKNLESVFSQVATPGSLAIEHIVIDGNSTDESVPILKRWDSFVRGTAAAKESRYSFQFISEPDKGQTDAINKGLRRATGDVVAWLNADEWYLPGKLASVADVFTRHPKVDFVYGEPLYVDGEGTPLRIKRDHPFSRFVLLHYGCYIASCCSFWRRRILDDGQYLDPSYKVVMDGEYWARICREGYRFRFLPATVAAFAWHDGNVSLEFDARRREEEHGILVRYGRIPAWSVPIMKAVSHRCRQMLVLGRLLILPCETVEGIIHG